MIATLVVKPVNQMKTLRFFSLAALTFVLPFCAPVHATQIYSVNIVGYVNRPFAPGSHLFGNPLHHDSNALSLIMPTAPDGATVTLWDQRNEQFLPDSTYVAGSGWTINYVLDVGMGALLTTPMTFTNTFVGEVLQGPDTTPADFDPPLPPVLGPGIHLLSSLAPMSDRTFEDMIGRSPTEGEFVRMLNSGTQLYTTSTFTGGAWDNGDPVLQIGQAAFFGLNGRSMRPIWVPEPSSFTFLLIGAAGLLARNRSR
jgi:hypothetical protein